MTLLAIFLAAAALLLSLFSWFRASSLAARIYELEAEWRRFRQNATAEAREELETLRQLLKRHAAGEPIDAEMVDEGRLWREIDASQAEALTREGNVLTIDVRTPREWAAGVIPGALRISIEELEQRYREIPDDDRRKLLVCAMGVRSAAACDFLAAKGYRGLLNLGGGMSAWRGQIERPA